MTVLQVGLAIVEIIFLSVCDCLYCTEVERLIIGANIKEQESNEDEPKKSYRSVNVTQSMICQIERGSKIPSVYLGKGRLQMYWGLSAE